MTVNQFESEAGFTTLPRRRVHGGNEKDVPKFGGIYPRRRVRGGERFKVAFQTRPLQAVIRTEDCSGSFSHLPWRAQAFGRIRVTGADWPHTMLFAAATYLIAYNDGGVWLCATFHHHAFANRG